MAKTKTKTMTKTSDSAYVLKLILYLIIGSQWVFIVDPGMTKQLPVPVGFVIGLLFASHEHFKIDRKIEYAVLMVAMLVGFWSNSGWYVSWLNS